MKILITSPAFSKPHMEGLIEAQKTLRMRLSSTPMAAP